MIAVCVTFEIVPGRMPEFRPLMEQQARDSLGNEQDCLRFDICCTASQVFLYELYTSRDAFARHLDTPHFKSFDASTAEMVAEKTVRIFDDVIEGQKQVSKTAR